MRAKSDEPGASAERELISQFREPYSPEQWAFIAATTRNTSDAGFDLLQHNPAQADAALKDYQRMLSNDPAERRIRDAIVRAEISPRLAKGVAALAWSGLVAEMQDRYGPLGAEAAYQEELGHTFGPLATLDIFDNVCRDDLERLIAARPDIAEALQDPRSAESRRRDALVRNAITPFFSRQVSALEWNGNQGIGPFLANQTEQHGLVGFSAVCSQGKAMYGAAILKRFLPMYERSYIEYLKTAFARSNLAINGLSWFIFSRSRDPVALTAAVAADKYSMETFEPNDPNAIDTYANLLYKTGRVAEALQYEKRAVELSGGHSDDINRNYHYMETGKPTWATNRSEAGST
jgi:tetratricopeptide (TPR) repeat protein